MKVYVECNKCFNLNLTSLESCSACKKYLVCENINVFYLANENESPSKLLQTLHDPLNEEYHNDLVDYYYLDLIGEINQREDYTSYSDLKNFYPLYSLIRESEGISQEQVLLKFLMMLVKVNDDNNKRLPYVNKFDRSSSVQIGVTIIVGIFILKPELVSGVKKDFEKNISAFFEKCRGLILPLYENTSKSSYPPDLNGYLFVLLIGLIQDLEAINNSFK